MMAKRATMVTRQIVMIVQHAKSMCAETDDFVLLKNAMIATRREEMAAPPLVRKRYVATAWWILRRSATAATCALLLVSMNAYVM